MSESATLDLVSVIEDRNCPSALGAAQIDSRIAALDLTQIRRKLMEPEPEGQGWSEEFALEAEKWYRRFLHVVLRYPSVRPVPNHYIDAFWHQHILDTRAYARDCHVTFGRFLHHYPYFGMNGDAAQRNAGFDETNAVYRAEFCEDCLSMSTEAQNCKPPCSAEACKAGCKQCTVDG